MPAGSLAVVFPVASVPAPGAEPEAEEFTEVPALVEVPLVSALADAPEEFIAPTPGLLRTSDPAGPGTELPTAPELLPPVLPLAPMLSPLPLALPDAPTPAPPDVPASPPAPCAKANVAIASERVAPSTIVGIFFFIANTP